MTAVTDPGSQTPSTTFKGRLKLDDFRYSNTPRRSPRTSKHSRAPATLSSASSPLSSHAQTPSRNLKPPPPSSSASSTSSAHPTKSKKRKRASTGYAPPSTYAHLPLLPDAICPNLLVLFIGLNPGISTAQTGHAYAHPTNLFWKLLYTSGITPRPCLPEEDRQMPQLYRLGLTNIVSRPSRNGSELSKAEMDQGVAILDDKARKWRPESICVVGKSIWESIWRVRHGRPVGKDFKYGWQDEKENMGAVTDIDKDGQPWPGARVFVATSTSGLAATLSPAEKQQVWNQLGAWVKQRRRDSDHSRDGHQLVSSSHFA